MSRIVKAAALTAAAGATLVGFSGAAVADSGALGAAAGSPGVISGNVIQVPIQIPINLCGNSIDIIALLNPTFGNTCINSEMEEHHFESEEHHHHEQHEHHEHHER
ncbi:chaplin [Streptomyces hesseae]|uniref:Chaplin n=1 Tax=Streptomyces hesseae TaxID=3075519 RepID=A0ABU2SN08_9ACTN|nr:chaplin [Streptomyces sp. DSM 40473]MDT0450358.1 chaplin [Streptomyces sp. DSM 40473]